MKIQLDRGAILPTIAHEDDAGYDLYTQKDVLVPKSKTEEGLSDDGCPLGTFVDIGCVAIDTGVHAEIPKGYVGYIKSKLGLNVKHGLTAEGVIDCGYTGSIVVKLYNHTSKDYLFKAGDKIAQLVIHPILTPDLEVVDKLGDTERGDGGFGSSGR